MKYLEDVLIAPVISEKSYDRIADSNSYTFFVHPKTDKPQIKKAVEQIFDVNERHKDGSLVHQELHNEVPAIVSVANVL